MGPYSGPTGESFKKVKWSQKVLVSGELMVAHLLYCTAHVSPGKLCFIAHSLT